MASMQTLFLCQLAPHNSVSKSRWYLSAWYETLCGACTAAELCVFFQGMPRKKTAGKYRMPQLDFVDSPPLNTPWRPTTPSRSCLCPVTADVVNIDEIGCDWVCVTYYLLMLLLMFSCSIKLLQTAVSEMLESEVTFEMFLLALRYGKRWLFHWWVAAETTARWSNFQAQSV